MSRKKRKTDSTSQRQKSSSRRRGGKRKSSQGRKYPKVTEELVLSILTEAGHPLYLREIVHLSHVPPNLKDKVRHITARLLDSGKIVLLKGNRYGLVEKMQLVRGKLSMHPDGFGFVTPEDPAKDSSGQEIKDIFIPPRRVKGAVHGDTVLVRIDKFAKKGPEGTILRVISHGVTEIAGTFRQGHSVAVVIPDNDRLLFEVIIAQGNTAGARDGDMVVARIDHFPEQGRNPEGSVVRVLGNPEDMEVQTQVVLMKYDLPLEFPEEALHDTEALPDRVIDEDLRGRRDLRGLPLVTIDGVKARDFDDAVHVKKTRSGYVLTVAIADVSHYVQRKSHLDSSAYERGTSVYFPGSVIPMLPEALSNNLCSLVPDEDRLVMVARIYFSLSGKVKKSTFFKAVMRSHRRFTYEEVQDILDFGKDVRSAKKTPRSLIRMVLCMEELAGLLGEQRRARGSIDFDLPESELVLGLQGRIEEIVRRERKTSHRLIEEFMIAANEAVARFFEERSVPALYRIHEVPEQEKISDFVDFARTLGLNIKMPGKITPEWCQGVLEMASGTPQEYIINTMLLRTMRQAVYSATNLGHFGLASTAYLHFTSPIRRYPDLIVHRILKGNLRKVRKRPVYTEEQLAEAGSTLSKRERVAMEAEWELLDRLKVRYMAEHIGEEFVGVISGTAAFGFFVELSEILISGVVRLVDLADDYYEFDRKRHQLTGKKTGRVFRLGQPVKVRVKDVNIARRQINFEIVSG